MTSTPTLVRRNVIAGVQLYGGITGVARMAPVVGAATSSGWRVVGLLLLAYYVACFAAGMLLLRERRLGATMTIWLQIPLLVFVYTDLVTYDIVCGFTAAMMVDPSFTLHFNFAAVSGATIATGNHLSFPLVGVNLFAVLTLWQVLAYMDAVDSTAAVIPAPSQGPTA